MADGAGSRPTAARLIVEALEKNGVERVFCVPGESYLALLDALHDSPIAVTLCRQEGGAAMAAEAWGKLTGRPGIVMVTRGPGATNASAGIHVGRQDFDADDRLHRPGRARHARPRGVPGDRLPPHVRPDGEVDRGDRQRRPRAAKSSAAPSTRRPPAVPARWCCRCPRTCCARRRPWPIRALGAGRDLSRPHPDGRTAEDAVAGDERPSSSPAARAGARRRSPACSASPSASQLPVGCSWRRQGLFDNAHPNYAGDIGVGINPALAQRVREADLLLLIGGRMSEMPSSGYTLIDIPEPQQTLVHVHPGAEELGRLYRPTLAINASPTAFAAALEGLQPPNEIPWRGSAEAANAAYRAWSAPVDNPGPVQLSRDRRLAQRAPARRRHRRQRRRQLFRLGASLLPPSPLRHPARPRLRLDGLRPAGGACRQAQISRAHGRRLRRRRRFPDDHAGIRHRRSGRRQRHRGGRQQRHPRHHPHAPGARTIPTAASPPTIANPDFAAYRPRLWRPRRDGGRPRRISPPPSSAASRRASRRSSIWPSIRKRSRRRARSRRSAGRRRR